MAWHSSGNTNEELVDNLVENNQISSTCVVDAFRSVDRIHFVPKGAEEYAYHDSPLKEGNVHISAPHIYCTVVEALDLEQNSNLSFLNIGSGTGYLSCIVGHILGASSLSYGVELHDDVLQHSKAAINAWKDAREDTSNDPPFDFFHGNGFHISSQEGESRVGYDRIYVGAQISIELEKIKKLLAPGGILVAPVNESLMKVIRMDVEKMSTNDSSLSPLTLSTEYVSNEITGVHFAPLQRRPKIDIVIPAKKWSPSLHSSYPQSFQDSVKEILLCSRTPYNVPEKRVPVNMSATLPRDIWVHIFSFANRNWFNKEIGELPILRRSLRYEQNAAAEANLELAQLQARNALLEREREICMNMMRRWRTQMQYSLQQRESYATRQPQSSSMEEDPLLLSAQSLLNETNAIISTYRIRPQGMDVDHMDDDDDDDDDEDNDDDDDDDNERGMMDLDSQSGEHQVEESDEDNDDNDNRRHSFDMIDAEEREHDHERQHEEVVRHHLNPVTAIIHSIVERPQIRSVSITNEDL
uniref:Protein-L-isoaspartate(D-aspartate) O-methyltransferase n=1 Tax=Chaetoceros debilis TaxID=122233 RepID=A0A7S3V953_9STRA|mmetsp:Transcript_14582/g.21741  ORF Transcript_14582/g.21741 Transcript_14582/m.21741 type:complete len:526 (-) Transcript_14582:184-1761(-)|eukprot:CAMPEP_0194105618 /NCGR_PEP_ID=MMETSP0150-20130528/5797_1 /TAXON_ID=122233 /ORGANISM="Chaetoceros debilis, Strain MM31A-1" /LENGTH=525 /DNA_ID=CAMNT_0038793543 /DNA_START=28 /DNA_END=1605 /DNA_ORIENTATION=-